VVADALPSSLVLIDELGKGTEVVSGTALAAGILQKLARNRVM
jgi:DNA mismatch repair ATPase MutS